MNIIDLFKNRIESYKENRLKQKQLEELYRTKEILDRLPINEISQSAWVETCNQIDKLEKND